MKNFNVRQKAERLKILAFGSWAKVFLLIKKGATCSLSDLPLLFKHNEKQDNQSSNSKIKRNALTEYARNIIVINIFIILGVLFLVFGIISHIFGSRIFEIFSSF